MLNDSVDKLKIEIKKLKENETLLLKYPDLHGPIDQLDLNEVNLCEDMVNQINANNYRIYLLENINKKLSNSIIKLKKNDSLQKNDEKIKIPDNLNIINNESDNFESLTFSTCPKSKKLSRPAPLFKLENEIEYDLNASSKDILYK
jgi:hypothetical protein